MALHTMSAIDSLSGFRTASPANPVHSTDRNLIEKWFHTLNMRIDRFHNLWVGSRASVREWLEHFVYYNNHHRPHQTLDGKVSVEQIQN